MNSTTLTTSAPLKGMKRLCKQQLFRLLQRVDYGTLKVTDAEGSYTFTGKKQADSVVAEIVIRDPACYPAMVLGGSIGAGESYMSGDWDSPNTTDVIRFMSQNLATVQRLDSGFALLSKPAQLAYHLSNRNTEKGSRRNIAAHYDLGNEMFKLFLDPTMMYSSAVFPRPDASLQQGSLYKLQRICQKLDLKPSDHLVEIGTGWGGMAIYAARHYGCRVTTTTISQQQYDYAREQIQLAGVGHLVTLLKEDYRNLQGKYNKLVSIEMIEAVGHQYYPDYFRALGRLLEEDGLALIQAITIDDQRYEKAKNNIDWIQRYIFPGACLPSVKALTEVSGRNSDLALTHLEDITPHYARTLQLWRQQFFDNIDAIRALGYNEEFIRMWDYYFCYCEGGFAERIIGDVQMLFAKPMYRGPSVLGQL
ncbi:SAM-dependent methyltransferase [Ketobacter sp.]|uniref:SAM-dependent methyltransferase n=1 Tax=Ketobacter sp. TaxID=2083498 RepID=UPI000F14E733|nr:cyclopropane-fatty-acyl-phospholipid synthase family protein [Ketobacter sp.]RLU01625.1 MAG: class I SAM-dependent methyltransferase [Ketobacter sp.]